MPSVPFSDVFTDEQGESLGVKPRGGLLLRTPDNKSRLALAYLRQFVHLTGGHSELKHGYISDSFINVLHRVDKGSNSTNFGSAFESIEYNGETSTTVTKYSNLTLIEVENSVNAKNSI